MSEQTNDHRQFITFMANGQEFASNIMVIREIRGWTETTTVPHVPDYVRGVVNLRGTVLPVIDLKARLGLGMTDATVKNVIIVIDTGSHMTGLIVDAVSDIITLTNAEVQAPPEIMRNSHGACVDGIAVVDGRMVTLLEMTQLTAGVSDAVLDEVAA